MSLPPETVGLASDFLAALTGLLYVVGGYFLGKWQSDERVLEAIGEINVSQKVLPLDLGIDKFGDAIERSAKRSKWMGITCVAVGAVLFVARLIL